MKPREHISPSVVPFLTQFAVSREGSDDIPGCYDAAMQVWVVGYPDNPVPIIDSGTALLELATKTDVVREQDDPGPSLLELATKTAVKSEQDDYPIISQSWRLVLETTTKVGEERPDFDSYCDQRA
jgi:hypothetical protein